MSRLPRGRTDSNEAQAKAAAPSQKKHASTRYSEAAGSTNVAEGGAAKGGGGKGGGRSITLAAKSGEMDIKGLLVVLMKSSLNNSQLIRFVTGTIWTTFKSDMEHPVMKAMLEEATKYNEAVAAEGKGHTRGSPHVHIATAGVEGMVSLEDLKTRHKDAMTAIKHRLFDQDEACHDSIASTFLHWRVKRLFKKKDEEGPRFAVLSFAVAAFAKIDGQEVQCMLTDAFESIGWQRLLGPPPKGELERQLEAWLHKFQ